MQTAQAAFIKEKLPALVERAEYIVAGYGAQCSKVAEPEAISGVKQFAAQMKYYIMTVAPQVQQPAAAPVQQPDEQPAEQQSDNQ